MGKNNITDQDIFITPKGYLFSTAEAAIKKPGRKDIALICSLTEANIAGVFTTNAVKAAPVKICMKKIRSGKGQVIIVNSGNANACTGKQGIKDAEDLIALVSKKLGLKSSLTYIASTGVIGVPLPMDRIRSAVETLIKNFGRGTFDDVAKAIMTTDTFPKMVSKRIKINGEYGTISGICKGAGMIAPNMATMLCFIITDIAIQQNTMQTILKASVNKSFNRITIDGDMSTNDTVLFMSNGKLGNTPISKNSEHFSLIQKAIDEITYKLARLIIKDGEGATKFVEVIVNGARNEADAEKAAFAVANSNLVKTAIYGNDANWGRIMSALGYSGIKFNPDRTDIYFNNVMVVKNGVSNNKDKEASEALKSSEIKIKADLHSGRSSVRVLTCDFSVDYVRINAEYRT